MFQVVGPDDGFEYRGYKLFWSLDNILSVQLDDVGLVSAETFDEVKNIVDRHIRTLKRRAHQIALDRCEASAYHSWDNCPLKFWEEQWR